VRPEIATQQRAAEALSPSGLPQTPKKPEDGAGRTIGAATPQASPGPKRFHGSVELDPTRVGRDAGRVADEVIAHLAGLVGATVKVTLDIAAEIPSGEKLSVTNGGDGRGQLGGHLYLCALFLNQYSRRLAIAS
jgi:hypothetical protein